MTWHVSLPATLGPSRSFRLQRMPANIQICIMRPRCLTAPHLQGASLLSCMAAVSRRIVQAALILSLARFRGAPAALAVKALDITQPSMTLQNARRAPGGHHLLHNLRERRSPLHSLLPAISVLPGDDSLLALLQEYQLELAAAGRGQPSSAGASPTAAGIAALEQEGEVYTAEVAAAAFEQQPRQYAAPEPCSLLSPGMSFEGVQRVSMQAGRSKAEEQWVVGVQVQGYDHSRGYVCGTMQASNLPEEASAVTTYFEGEVIDNVHHTFFTPGWDATAASDLRHWSRLPGFAALRSEVLAHSGRAPRLAAHPWLYLRFKEQFFLARGSDCRLSIAGFYYLALHRTTGEVTGLYFDPSSAPDQLLMLRPARQPGAGLAFAEYVLA